jgi:uncharacterized Zn finger protein
MGGRFYDYGDSGSWPKYVSVAELHRRAQAKIAKLRKADKNIEPVEIKGRLIARNFWGKAWCRHLESFSDYDNRLPRGRTYVRSGSVCDLRIKAGKVEAKVLGSHLYNIWVRIDALEDEKWTRLKSTCQGNVRSLIDLLQGTFSDEVMRAVVDPDEGLFPLAGEFTYSCDCPDYADMCKHVSAVMYGIGARLDEQPELLFHLRGVNHEDLLAIKPAADALLEGSRRSRRRTLKGGDLEALFGVELEAPAVEGFTPSGPSIVSLRNRLGLTKRAFAEAAGASVSTVSKWEATPGALTLQAKHLAALQRLSKK